MIFLNEEAKKVLEKARWKSGNELLEEVIKKQEVRKKMSQFEEYMEKRSQFIKEGKSLSDATNQAFLDAYHPKEKIDPQSYKDR